ncbi:MAG: ankyrin repeat domain-containing protein [Syntrophorhabdales bacterium]|jgi:ankyrin repeat protein
MTLIEELPYGSADLGRLRAVKSAMMVLLCMMLFGGIAPLFAAPPPNDAAEMDRLKMVKEAFEKGEDINGKDPAGGTLLMAAADIGDFRVVKYLIEKGADVNAVAYQGQTALLSALYRAHFDIARYLFQKGADVNLAVAALREPKIPPAAAYMAMVAFCLDTDTLSLAFAKGLNESSRDLIWSNLAPALGSRHCKPEAIKLFLEKGANVNLDLGEGGTPLMAAARGGQLDIVQLL